MAAVSIRVSGPVGLYVSLALAACGGGGGDPGNVTTVGGAVDGLTAPGLVLQLNEGQDLAVPGGATEFVFATGLQQGREYRVQVKTQPAGQTCTVNRERGTMPARRVTDVLVKCGSEAHLVGGSVAGLSEGESVVLALNGQAYPVAANVAYQFPNAIPFEATYGVTVQTTPAGKGCWISNGAGTMGHGDVTNVDVTCSRAPDQPSLAVSAQEKRLRFAWVASPRATSYRFYEDPDGSGFVQRGSALTGLSWDLDIAVHRLRWNDARYRVDACNSYGCTPSPAVGVGDRMLDAIGYHQASNAHPGASFGVAIAISADGETMAVGSTGEGEDVVGGNLALGAVYVFVRTGSTWNQQAYLRIEGDTSSTDSFGGALALSADGDTLVTGQFGGFTSGSTYVFTREGSRWSQEAQLEAPNANTFWSFGAALALSADGNTVAVGAPGEAECDTELGGDQDDMSCIGSGAAYVFTRVGTRWSFQKYFKASTDSAGFGDTVALSADGNLLAVGRSLDVHLFSRSGATWNEQAVLASPSAPTDCSLDRLALSADGYTLAVAKALACPYGKAGSVLVYSRSGGSWTQQARLGGSNSGAEDHFGDALALDGDGDALAVGAYDEDAGVSGIAIAGADDSAPDSGAAYLFRRSGASWSEAAYIKASSPVAGDHFGYALGIGSDSETLIVGAYDRESGAGAVYVY